MSSMVSSLIGLLELVAFGWRYVLSAHVLLFVFVSRIHLVVWFMADFVAMAMIV